MWKRHHFAREYKGKHANLDDAFNQLRPCALALENPPLLIVSEMARDLFGGMATGGRIGFETVAWFNGGLFDNDAALLLNKADIETTLKASELDWSEIDPSILGTLFERGLDPDNRSQLGSHCTKGPDHADHRAGGHSLMTG